MMKIEHAALWVKDLEGMKDFYVEFFQAQSNKMYHNPAKGFRSYFLSFDSGCRLELMQKDGINQASTNENKLGWAHLAFSTGSKEKVDQLTEKLRGKGFDITGEPRTTGDGYYESVILDPEGNSIEITI